MNLVNCTKTPIFRVFETIKSEAARYGVNVTSSEIVGLVPNDAIIDVADFYLRLENFSKAQVLEEKLRSIGTEAAGTVTETFYDEVASLAPAPGGGSVAASAGALSAALAAMVSRLTVGKKQYADVKEEMTEVVDNADALRAELTHLIETDKEAFNKVMESFKLSPGEQRDKAVEEATKGAALVPLTVMKKSVEALKLVKVVAEKGNVNSISDAGVAGLMGMAAVDGAWYNVRINLSSLTDSNFVTKTKEEASHIRKEAVALSESIRDQVESKL